MSLLTKWLLKSETSTVENGFNDLLKILQLLKSDDIQYGVIIFVQNNRKHKRRLTAPQLRSNLVAGLNKVLDDYRGKLLIYHIDMEL